MGANIVRRLVKDGHECVVYDHDPDAVKAMAGEERTTGVSSLAELAEKMAAPRVVWVMVPAGDITTDRDRRAFQDTRLRRHRDRRRQLLLSRRPQAREAAVREGHSPAGRRHQRRGVGPRARLLPDDRRRRRRRSRTRSRSSLTIAPGFDAAPRTPGRDGGTRAIGEGLPALRPDRAPGTSSRWCTTGSSTA